MESVFPINQVVQRYQIPLNKDVLYSYEELTRLGIDQSFILTLLETFEDEKSFDVNKYNDHSLELIIDYIRRTHVYYLSKKLLEIEQSIENLTKNYSVNHPLLSILDKFFKEYTLSLTAHIREEEQFLLPYIEKMLLLKSTGINAEKQIEISKSYSLKSFIDSHHDTEKDIENIREIILQYQAPSTNQTMYRILLLQLENFEKDLFIHALIEDKVLIPRAFELESQINQLKCM